MPIYNEDILEKAAKFQRDVAAISTAVRFLHSHGTKLKDSERLAEVERVKALARGYGFGLTDWTGQNEPKPESVKPTAPSPIV